MLIKTKIDGNILNHRVYTQYCSLLLYDQPGLQISGTPGMSTQHKHSSEAAERRSDAGQRSSSFSLLEKEPSRTRNVVGFSVLFWSIYIHKGGQTPPRPCFLNAVSWPITVEYPWHHHRVDLGHTPLADDLRPFSWPLNTLHTRGLARTLLPSRGPPPQAPCRAYLRTTAPASSTSAARCRDTPTQTVPFPTPPTRAQHPTPLTNRCRHWNPEKKHLVAWWRATSSGNASQYPCASCMWKNVIISSMEIVLKDIVAIYDKVVITAN